MGKRTRNIQKKFYVSEDENDKITAVFKKSGYNNITTFFRDCVLDKNIINIDLTPLNCISKEVNKIGANINQISKGLNIFNQLDKENFAKLTEQHNELYKIIVELKRKFASI